MKRLLAVLVLLVAPGAWAGSPPPKPHKCKLCRDTHRIPCRLHDRRARRPKPFCSACLEPECCSGVRWTPCPKCADEATKRKFEAIRAMYAKERRGEGFYPWGEGLFCAACEHFRFKAAATHRECHEFHAVAEKAFGLFLRLFGEQAVDKLQWREKGHFLILASSEQFDKLLNWYVKNGRLTAQEADHYRGSRGVRMINECLDVTVRSETGGAREDLTSVLHHIAHGAGHLVIENYIGRTTTPDWWGEGWAGRSEIEALGKPLIYCTQYEAGGHKVWPPQQWQRTVRDAIRNRTLPSFEKLFAMQVGDMAAVEWAMSISIVSWMVERFPPSKTVAFVDALRAGKSSKAAFEQVFERELGVIEKAWQRWARRQ